MPRDIFGTYRKSAAQYCFRAHRIVALDQDICTKTTNIFCIKFKSVTSWIRQDLYREKMDTSDLPPTATRDFNIALVLFQVFGLTSIILLGYWEGRYQQATWEWRDPPEQFWYHPLLMTIGFVFIHGNGRWHKRCTQKAEDLYVIR